MKKTLAILLSLVTVLCLTACAKDVGDGKAQNSATSPAASATANPFEIAAGNYTGVHSKFVGDSEWSDEEFSLTLNADGTGVHKRDGSEFKVTWKLDGEAFTMEETFIGDPIEYTGTLKGTELELFNGDPSSDFTYEYVYTKTEK